jgi:chromosome segregation ATPase
VTQADRELAETQTAYEDTLADYQSTSAQLRETQRALAASQQDLSRCEEVLDQLREARDKAWHAHDLTLAELTTAIQERDLLRAQLDQAVVHFDRRHTELREAFQQLKAVYHRGLDVIDDTRAQLAAANAEIERLRAADKESAQ